MVGVDMRSSGAVLQISTSTVARRRASVLFNTMLSFLSTASGNLVPGRYDESMSAITPGRRRGPRKGDTREADILRTFEQLIGTKPLAAIGIDELALGAGISRSAFYFYFGSKDAVLSALIQELEADLMAEYADWYQGSGLVEAEASLRRSLTYVVALWQARGPLLRLVHLAADVPEPVQQFRARSMERQTRLTVERIERERAAGLAPAGPPSATALAIGMIQLRTALLSDAFAPEDDRAPTSDPAAVIEDVIAAQLRLLYGRVPEAGAATADSDVANPVGANL
jgi:AcrR family transcriptional regulator